MSIRNFRRLRLALLALAGFWLSAGRAQALAPKSKKPNVIIIITDDQGWGDLSINGNKNLHTPHIDQIGRQGARFDQFYVSPVCSPTRAELLTGRYHPRLGVYSTSEGGERMNLGETTLAEVFRKAGYATGAFGKWHNGMQYPYHPNARGFETFYGFCSGHWGDYFSPLLEHNGKLVQGKGFIIDDLTDQALHFMEQNQNKPFFLYVPYNTPHSPMQVPDRWWDKFKDKELTMRADEVETEDLDFTRAALAMCENIDWNVGRIQDKLRALHLDQQTIVVYLSDNGPNGARWNGGMKGRKGSTDEGGIRSPLLMQWPGMIAPGMQVNQIAGVIDLLPTLADLAGIPYQVARSLDGRSLKPLLLSPDQPWPERLLFSHWNGRVSVRSQQYRLDAQGKLYDIQNDPGQLREVTALQADIARQLSQAREAWKAEVLPGIAADKRPFPVGHARFAYTQLPARDGQGHGGIVRSNKFPNSSYFTNWTSTRDSISWEVEVLTAGNYAVDLYYSCPAKDLGATLQLAFGKNRLRGSITEAHDPPLKGKEHDRVARTSSYEKDFRPMRLGTLRLEKGSGNLSLKALQVPGSQVMDLRLLLLTRVK